MRTEIWNLLGHLHSDFYQLLPLYSKTGFPMSLLRTTKRVIRSKPGISLWKWPLSLLVLSHGHFLQSLPQAHVPSPHREDHLWASCPDMQSQRRKEKHCFKHKCKSEALQSILHPPFFLVIRFSFNHLCSHKNLGYNPSSLQIARF